MQATSRKLRANSRRPQRAERVGEKERFPTAVKVEDEELISTAVKAEEGTKLQVAVVR